MFSNSFYSTEWGLHLFLLLLLQSDRLAPYCFCTFLADTHNYLAGIHNYFFTIQTLTTVHHDLPLGGWYCTISFFFSSALPTQWACSAPPQDFEHAEPGHPRADCVGTSQVVAVLFAFCFSSVQIIMPWVFLTLPACSLI